MCYAKTLDHVLSGSLASRDDPTGIGSYTFGRANKRAKRQNNRNRFSKRVITSGNCNSPVYLALGEIPVDIPARLINYPLGNGGLYSVTLSPTAPLATTTPKVRKTITVPSTTTSTVYSTTTRVCDGSKYPQPCHHYSSVAQFSTYQKPTCAAVGAPGTPARPLVTSWDNQHNKAWSQTWITKTYINPNGKRAKPNCQRDEWPPAHFQQGRPDGYIRLLPGSQNSGVANSGDGGWKGFCKYPPDKQVKVEGGPIRFDGNIVYTTIYTSTIITLNVMDYQFTRMVQPANDRWLLTTNPCYPSTLTQDPGFALLTYDPYYGGVPTQLPYTKAPTNQYTMGKKPPSKRQLSGDVGPEFILDDQNTVWVEEKNTTRPASDAEMLEHLNLLKCATPDCAAELADWEVLEQQLRGETGPDATWTAITLATSTGPVVAGVTGAGSSPISNPVVPLASATSILAVKTATAEKIMVTAAALASPQGRFQR